MMRAVAALGDFVRASAEPVGHLSGLKRHLKLVAAVLTVIFTIVCAVELQAYLDYKQSLPRGAQHRLVLQPSPVEASWILAGAPEFRSAVFEGSPGRDDWSGVWECIGPGRFVWRYTVDEAIYIMEGSAEIDYLGETFELKAGDHARFVAGTEATWTVDRHVKKTFSVQNPGRFARTVRRVVRLFEVD